MQVFGCGNNTCGDFGEPSCCSRDFVNIPHECHHNDYGNNSPFCPFWVFKPKEIAHAIHSIRVISCENDSTVLDVDGELKLLDQDRSKKLPLTEVLESWKIGDITNVVRLADGYAFLFRDGTLVTVRHADGVHIFSGKPIQYIATRRVDWHNPNLISGAVAIVLKQDLRTVLSFDTWNPMRAFLESSEPSFPPIHSANFTSPVFKLTSGFAILTAKGEVFTWALSDKPLETWPSWEPVALDYEPKRQPLPPVKTLSTGGIYNVAVSHSGQLFVWGYKRNKSPEIEAANDRDSVEFKEAIIPAGNGGTPLKIKSAAAGRDHVIALAADGSAWSVGNGLDGQLGIGNRQFGLCTEGFIVLDEYVSREEYAVDWEKMDTEALEALRRSRRTFPLNFTSAISRTMLIDLPNELLVTIVQILQSERSLGQAGSFTPYSTQYLINLTPENTTLYSPKRYPRSLNMSPASGNGFQPSNPLPKSTLLDDPLQNTFRDSKDEHRSNSPAPDGESRPELPRTRGQYCGRPAVENAVGLSG
ncbi:hypothetical protein BO71DRAFT_406494 [Aspergillus ellipticus CBS 707.79]|uniref:RCC1/BLIP-II n=1 Tax=Aspergillus ellipticus CBS 707.79 TaxID=1448320 RepID=A0A319DMT8_9EURO|nr:hypothetical protein BO71DRAFT_406494 [Aspergillus ellipticus CBS 707.79]